MVDRKILARLKKAVASPGLGQTKYASLEAELSEMIANRQLPPGQRLPADKEFAEGVGVSLGTIQKALVGMHRKGLVTRAPKRGTTVAERQVGANDVFVFRFRDPATGALILPKVRTLSVRETATPGPWRDFLGGDRLICVERIMQIAVEPPVYSQVFIGPHHGASLLDQPMDMFAGFSVHRHLEEHHGTITLRSESRVSLGQFSRPAARPLALAEGTPSLVWDVANYTHEDRPVSFQRIQIPPNHRPLEFRRAYHGQAPLDRRRDL